MRYVTLRMLRTTRFRWLAGRLMAKRKAKTTALAVPAHLDIPPTDTEVRSMMVGDTDRAAAIRMSVDELFSIIKSTWGTTPFQGPDARINPEDARNWYMRMPYAVITAMAEAISRVGRPILVITLSQASMHRPH